MNTMLDFGNYLFDSVNNMSDVDQVRSFNRFYTQHVGALGGILHSQFSLGEARIIYELAQRRTTTATELSKDLNLDAGYLSRLLTGLKRRRIVSGQRSGTDGRRSLLGLTAKGQRAFQLLNARSEAEVATLLAKFPVADQQSLLSAMATIRSLLGGQPASGKPQYLLRPPRAGDMGWVVRMHGLVYGNEFGWDAEFEALIADLVAQYIRNSDPKRQCCWIAERHGEPVGSSFVTRESDILARLRLVIVDPRSRGLGIGAQLVHESIRFARGAGYQHMTLWTANHLVAARTIYARCGFHLVNSETDTRFSAEFVSETWELDLTHGAEKGSTQ